jgi:D-alanyl-D-alanine carboxypeptidase
MKPRRRLALLLLVSVLAAVEAVPARSQPRGSSSARAIDQLLSQHFRRDEPGATVVAVRDGQTLFRGAYGLASVELEVPMRPEMVLRIGSISKQFTATGVLILVSRGLMSLDDDITTYLRGYPTHGQRVTVRHLLTHTSGIPDIYRNPRWNAIKRDDAPADAVVSLFKDEPLDFVPGEAFRYSNAGYFLLGRILEVVSGQTYEQFLKAAIFDPLGMDATGAETPSRIIPWAVPGYNVVEGEFVRCGFLNMDHLQGQGNLRSRVDDLARWDAALYTERLLPASALEMLWTPHTLPDGTSTDYGFGMGISELDGHRMVGHRGSINGFDAYSLRLPESRVYVALLMNHGNPEVGSGDLAKSVARLVLENGQEDKREASKGELP